MVEEMQRQPSASRPTRLPSCCWVIYEDTGSLLYSGTTTRDIYAAAWLLEQGRVAGSGPPVPQVPAEREPAALYEQLTDALEIAPDRRARDDDRRRAADGYVEEISTLAHKLRDLFEPDALFLLVAMVDHIQVVARSTTDAIDVGAHHGAPGRRRAHPGPRPRSSTQWTWHRCTGELAGSCSVSYVRPSITVAQIMSHGVHTLAPGDTVTKAAEMMARYGHEGFPVVDDGRHRRCADAPRDRQGHAPQTGRQRHQPGDAQRATSTSRPRTRWRRYRR